MEGAGVGLSGAMSDPKEAGTALLKQGRFDEAAAVLREAVALDNNDEAAWRLLGGALASKGDNEGAIQAFQNAVRIVPMAARSHYNLGLAFQSAGRLPEAKSSLERAIALDPGHEQARTRLGEVAEQLGQPRPAGTASVPAEGHTNIGGGNATGLAAISSPSFSGQSQQQAQSNAGHSNIGGGNSSGLLTIGAHRDSPSNAPSGGHSNISGGANVSGLSSVGVGASLPQDTGHTNIGGGNTAMLGSVSAGGAPALRGNPPQSVTPPSSVGPMAPPSSIPPSASGYAPAPVLGQNYSQDMANTSGMQGDVPYEVAKPFNWGSFLFTWMDLGYLWAFNMRLPLYGGILLALSIISWVVGVGAGLNAAASKVGPGSFGWLNGVGGILFLARLGIGIYLGINGNKLAWQHRTFASAEDFHSCQRLWAGWGIGLFIAGIFFWMLIIVILGAAFVAVLSGAAGAGRSLGH